MTLLASTRKLITSWLEHDGSRPLIVGIQGLQGSGKTTLVSHLTKEFRSRGLNVVGCSIDDLYLTCAQIYKLSGNELLKGRGLPGTHDVHLGAMILDSLRNNVPVSMPVYDKSMYGGQGDRAKEDTWPQVQPPYDLVLFEGWMLGYEALREEEVQEIYYQDEGLQRYKLEDVVQVNANLKHYEEWYQRLDRMIYLCSDIENVVGWRWEQEIKMIEEKGTGMTREQVEEFVRRFLVCYRLFYAKNPEFPRPFAVYRLNKNRELVTNDV